MDGEFKIEYLDKGVRSAHGKQKEKELVQIEECILLLDYKIYIGQKVDHKNVLKRNVAHNLHSIQR